MRDRFRWLEVRTEFRELRPSKHGEELRWIVNREKIRNEETGDVVTRAAIRHPGICVIVPQFDDGSILLMNQYRYAAGCALWELPAGTLSGREEGGRMIATESAAECAHRELLEETGYEASRIEKLGECYALPGSSDELMHIFLARNLTQREQSLDIGEVIYEIRPFKSTEIPRLIGDGTIRDAKTIVGLTLALRWSSDGSRIEQH